MQSCSTPESYGAQDGLIHIKKQLKPNLKGGEIQQKITANLILSATYVYSSEAIHFKTNNMERKVPNSLSVFTSLAVLRHQVSP